MRRSMSVVALFLLFVLAPAAEAGVMGLDFTLPAPPNADGGEDVESGVEPRS